MWHVWFGTLSLKSGLDLRNRRFNAALVAHACVPSNRHVFRESAVPVGREAAALFRQLKSLEGGREERAIEPAAAGSRG